jgi:hypothetical protein
MTLMCPDEVETLLALEDAGREGGVASATHDGLARVDGAADGLMAVGAGDQGPDATARGTQVGRVTSSITHQTRVWATNWDRLAP